MALAVCVDGERESLVIRHRLSGSHTDDRYLITSSGAHRVGGVPSTQRATALPERGLFVHPYRAAAILIGAIRTLCDWPDYEATKTLFEIASNSETSLAHHVLSIRAIARLIESANFVSLEERVALALSTYDIARRTEEKGQIIATMGTLADTQIVDKLLGIAKGETLKTEAALALIQLAGNMQRSDRQASQELAQQILDMNISEQVNTQAQAVLSGRNRGRGNFGGNRGAGNTRGGNRAGGTRTGAAGTQRRGQ